MVKKFSEIGDTREPTYPEAQKLDAVPLNQTLIVKDFQLLPSSFGGEFAVVLAEINKVEVTFNTGSNVLLKQLDSMKDKLPVEATIIETKSKKSGRLYQTFI